MSEEDTCCKLEASLYQGLQTICTPVVADEAADSEDLESDLNFGSEEFAISDIELGSEELLDDEEDVSNFKFSEFAAQYIKGEDCKHTRTQIKEPLLRIENENDRLAAQTVWVTFLRFMGDLPESKAFSTPRGAKKHIQVMEVIQSMLVCEAGKDNSNEGPHTNAQLGSVSTAGVSLGRKRSIFSKLVSLIPKRKLKEVGKLTVDDPSTGSENPPFEDMLTTVFEKCQFIIGSGILRSNLRDEIYCQIMKQLTKNPSRSSHARGWILLALCVGCFVPSEQLIKYLINFIDDGPTGYAPYCKEKLKRTLTNGIRNQPPSWREFQAAKSKRSLQLPITLMNGNTITLNADSATTTSELCQLLAGKTGLTDLFGFSIYIAIFDKVSSLGSEQELVMDAVFQCEQFAKGNGCLEKEAPWRLFFRKEMFAPWHDPNEDSVATDLIYQQVVRGIQFGEYKCDKDDDLATIAAQQYYIQNGPGVSIDDIESFLSSFLPKHLEEKTSGRKYWVKMISKKLQMPYFAHDTFSELKAKEDIVSYAKYKWPLLFSRFYELSECAGPNLTTTCGIAAINWTGVYVVDSQEQVLLELSFPEIKAVASTKTENECIGRITLNMVNGDEYIFSIGRLSQTVQNLVMTFLDGLKKRSEYAIALQDHNVTDATLLKFRKRDLILLLKNSETENAAHASNWCVGECVHTKESGEFPIEFVYVIPTLTKPPQDMLTRISSGLAASQAKDSVE